MPRQTPDLRFTIEPHCSSADPYLQITLTFPARKSSTTILSIPHSWASESEYFRGIRNLAPVSEGTSLATTDKPDEYAVTHQPETLVVLRYQIAQYWDEPISHKNFFRPILKPTYFHFLGHGVFAVPQNLSSEPQRIEIDWINLPANWSLANSFGVAQHHQLIHRTVSDFLHSVFVAGDFTINAFDIQGHPLNVAVRGDWQFSVDEFNSLAQRIVSNGRAFWSDFEFPDFLVTMIPTNSTGRSLGGTCLSDSFALFVGHELKDIDAFKYLLAHELFHTWVGGKIDVADPTHLQFWFSEGFTNYYARLLNLRGGLISLPEYANDLNRTIEKYYLSPVRNAANEKVLQDFWTDRDVNELPYLRGDLLAHKWNHQIKSTTQDFSLDDLMHALFREATTNNAVFSASLFDRLSRAFLASGLSDDIEQHVEQGETILLNDGTLGPCFKLQKRETHQLDLGFNFRENLAVVSEVRLDSAAYRAGLRDGQTIVTRNLGTRRAEDQVILNVLDPDGSERIISYFPRGAAVEIPQFVLDEDRYQRSPRECLTWFEKR